MMRAVIDTGVFVSALIRPQGKTGAVLQALKDKRFTMIYSTDILVEIIDVLGRDKFRSKYHISPDDIAALIDLIRLRGELVIPSKKLTVCRDPKDDIFLEAALEGKAEYIVSGDFDLLDMKSFENIPILRVAEFLARI
ncbi:MAG: putative toxin-antitoxin system toxin component, PIN family [Anaerolineales bacterium]|uniref:Putative toxin-antitoxin system toxin component, PIN family n=1 Tax=Candidatus Desulfolinea nitratireducens TaxID=2841698 RepID=A0A8J6NMB8_9CHLR|nr:putative toxin-antitoxin system toxin component, PIN family [Candidatus Desulfolinea nitratireducens]